MVCWEIREECGGCGPLLEVGLGGSFSAAGSGGAAGRSWRWVPRAEAVGLHRRFLNMGDGTPDERWARYAFQKDGIVQFPPTEAALEALLRRCGLDADRFGTGGYGSLGAFWGELTTQESYLEMRGGRPLRVMDVVVVRLRWRGPDGARRTLVQVCEQGPADRSGAGLRWRLFFAPRPRGERWEDAALQSLARKLGLAPGDVKAMLAHQAGDQSAYLFYEELKETKKFPGVQCRYRTHLVTYTLREDVLSLPQAWALGLSLSGDLAELADGVGRGLGLDPGAAAESTSVPLGARSRKRLPSSCSLPGRSAVDLVWLDEGRLREAHGAGLWDRAASLQETRRVSSVLLGLEGTAPGMRSPFGTDHDMSGASSPISAVGNSKWRRYRLSNGFQIPADIGGLRMSLTRGAFRDFVEACRQVPLPDPAGAPPGGRAAPARALPRELLEQRFAEQELFKQILGGCCREAHQAVAAMVERWADLGTTAQAHAAVLAPAAAAAVPGARGT